MACRAGRSYEVQVSTDDGMTWRTVASGLDTPRARVDRRGFAPGDLVEIRVVEVREAEGSGTERTVVACESFRA